MIDAEAAKIRIRLRRLLREKNEAIAAAENAVRSYNKEWAKWIMHCKAVLHCPLCDVPIAECHGHVGMASDEVLLPHNAVMSRPVVVGSIES